MSTADTSPDPQGAESGGNLDANHLEAEKRADELLGAAGGEGGDYKHAADEVSGILGGRHMGARWVAKDVAKIPAEEAETADRAAGEEAVLTDEDRVAVEHDVATIQAASSGAAIAAEAEQIKAEVEKDSSDAIDAGLALSQIATDAVAQLKGDHMGRLAPADERRLTEAENPTLLKEKADEETAQKVLSRASHDLSDADNARQKLEGDMKAAGLTPDAASPVPPPGH